MKLVAWRCAELHAAFPRLLLSDHHCSFHLNALVQALALRPQLATLKRVYSIVALSRTGSNFLRLIHALSRVASKTLVVHIGVEPPKDCKPFARQLLEYACLHHTHQSKKRGKPGDAAKAMAAFRTFMESVLAFFNGKLWLSVMERYCVGSCCNHQKRSVSVATAVKLLLRFIFRSPPSSPNIGKWTKFGPSIDKFFRVHDTSRLPADLPVRFFNVRAELGRQSLRGGA